jgi:ABC-type Fe3+ transport system permease subunit
MTLQDSVLYSVDTHARDSVWDSVWYSVEVSVWYAVRAGVSAVVMDFTAFRLDQKINEQL